MAEQAKVTINGQEFEVDKGARLIDVCREKGFGIPSFCYYKDLALQYLKRLEKNNPSPELKQELPLEFEYEVLGMKTS